MQKFSKQGESNYNKLMTLLNSQKQHQFINLAYDNVVDHIAIISLDKSHRWFEGIFYIDVKDFTLFDMQTRYPRLTRFVLEVCEDLAYDDLNV